MTTHTITPHPVLSCFAKMSDNISGWMPSGETSKFFIDNILPHITEVEQFSEEELRAWVSNSDDELNEMLKKEGFDIRIQHLAPRETGFLSILKIVLKWMSPGTKCTIQQPEKVKQHSGVVMKKGVQILILDSPVHSEPIVCISCENGDRVFMTIADTELSGFNLFSKLYKINSGLTLAETNNITHVKFPMIDLDQQPDISWLQGMTHPEVGIITQALQQTKFKMNEQGALLESAVVITTYRGCILKENSLIINEPFFFWIQRPGIDLPIFCAYMDTDVWKEPTLKN